MEASRSINPTGSLTFFETVQHRAKKADRLLIIGGLLLAGLAASNYKFGLVTVIAGVSLTPTAMTALTVLALALPIIGIGLWLLPSPYPKKILLDLKDKSFQDILSTWKLETLSELRERNWGDDNFWKKLQNNFLNYFLIEFENKDTAYQEFLSVHQELVRVIFNLAEVNAESIPKSLKNRINTFIKVREIVECADYDYMECLYQCGLLLFTKDHNRETYIELSKSCIHLLDSRTKALLRQKFLVYLADGIKRAKEEENSPYRNAIRFFQEQLGYVPEYGQIHKLGFCRQDMHDCLQPILGEGTETFLKSAYAKWY